MATDMLTWNAKTLRVTQSVINMFEKLAISGSIKTKSVDQNGVHRVDADGYNPAKISFSVKLSRAMGVDVYAEVAEWMGYLRKGAKSRLLIAGRDIFGAHFLLTECTTANTRISPGGVWTYTELSLSFQECYYQETVQAASGGGSSAGGGGSSGSSGKKKGSGGNEEAKGSKYTLSPYLAKEGNRVFDEMATGMLGKTEISAETNALLSGLTADSQSALNQAPAAIQNITLAAIAKNNDYAKKMATPASTSKAEVYGPVQQSQSKKTTALFTKTKATLR